MSIVKTMVSRIKEEKADEVPIMTAKLIEILKQVDITTLEKIRESLPMSSSASEETIAARYRYILNKCDLIRQNQSQVTIFSYRVKYASF